MGLVARLAWWPVTEWLLKLRFRDEPEKEVGGWGGGGYIVAVGI